MVLIVSEMADSLCGLIDGMYVGKFLGNDAMAAHGVAAPVFTFLCIFSYLIAAAIQHACPVLWRPRSLPSFASSATS